jgi:hypothetical protein
VQYLQTFFTNSGSHYLDAEGLKPQPAPRLQATVRQHVEQSGLLQQLPALMIAAAVELSVQAKDKSFIKYGQMLIAGEGTLQLFYACSIRTHARQLLQLFCSISQLWSDQLSRRVALSGVAAVVMQLCLAITRGMSAEVQEHMRSPGLCQHPTFDMQVRASLVRGRWAALGAGPGWTGCRDWYCWQSP